MNKTTKKEPAYWLYAPGEGASLWQRCQEESIMCLGWDETGDYTQFKTPEELLDTLKKKYKKKNAYNDKCSIWDFANEMKIGDIVFAKKGSSKIIGRGVVESDYFHDENAESYKNIRKIKWTDRGDYDSPISVIKTLTNITKKKKEVEKLNALFDEAISRETQYEKYTKKNFLEEVFMSSERLTSLHALIKLKKNIILQGAPGVGKTFAARKMAYMMMGEKDPSRVEFIQFHQNYNYEDFIMGYKPDEEGFRLRHGVFYNFCKKAQNNPEKDHFFIIDEINRGNLSKIFGELLMLIENGYRGEEYAIKLAYNEELFYVPQNLYIIGMMNTADRSLAMIDYALRRRFSFFEMRPAFRF